MLFITFQLNCSIVQHTHAHISRGAPESGAGAGQSVSFFCVTQVWTSTPELEASARELRVSADSTSRLLFSIDRKFSRRVDDRTDIGIKVNMVMAPSSLILCLAMGITLCHLANSSPTPVKRFTVNLDQPEEHRWDAIASLYKDQMRTMFTEVE